MRSSLARCEIHAARRVLATQRRRGLARTLHEPAPLANELARLRDQADAYRARAIVLNAKLAMLEPAHGGLRELRVHLIDSSMRIDRAVGALVESCARSISSAARDRSGGDAGR
jgi:hypothetical protein